MGSSSILVIGEDWGDQLDRRQLMEYADGKNRYIVNVDCLASVRSTYKAASHCGKSFTDWAIGRYGDQLLKQGEEPDLLGAHRTGWMCLNADGDVIELVQRDIPGGWISCFLGTCSDLLLKAGAVGWDFECSDTWSGKPYRAIEVTHGYVGSARRRDIDFAGMRQVAADAAATKWDAVHRIANGETWVPHTEIRRKYPRPAKYDAAIEQAAHQEWFAQPVLQRLYEASCTNDYTHEALDRMLLSRTEYVGRFEGGGVLPCDEVIRHGKELRNQDENVLLAELDDDELLTVAAVKY